MSTKINKKQREKETERQKGNNKKNTASKKQKKYKMTLHKACTFFQYEEHVKEGASSILNSALPCNCNMPSSTNKLHSGIVLYILQLPQEWGKCSAMGTPQALPPVPNEAPGAPCARGWSQVGSRIWTKRPCSTLLPTSSPPPLVWKGPQRLFTSVVPAPFCHSHSSFIWAWWPSTKIWPRGNYKMENRSQASTTHSLANAFF